MNLPKHGSAWPELEARMDVARAADVNWRNGRIGVYIHHGGDDVLEIAKRAYIKFFSENGLGPKAFPSLAKFEHDVIAMTLGLLHGGPNTTGSMTTGGTESIFLAVKAARDWARRVRPQINHPEILAAATAHPAFNKAAHFLGLSVRRIPTGPDFCADVNAMEAALGSDTIMLVGSAPAYPHGVIDPIPALAAIAERTGVWLHVDACVGGFIAPFARLLGAPIPQFDFALPGVRSISADLHKYGYAAKGASTVLYRDADSFKYQSYSFVDWPRGKYDTKTLVGTRAGGAIAAAWAVMNHLGEEGYISVTRRVLAIREAIERGVEKLGLTIWGKPELSIVTYGSERHDIMAVADQLETKGWYVSRLAEPRGIHLMLNLTHEPIVDEYLADLEWALGSVRLGASGSSAAKAIY